MNLFLDLIYEQCKQKLFIRGKLTSSLYRKRYLARERSLFVVVVVVIAKKKTVLRFDVTSSIKVIL